MTRGRPRTGRRAGELLAGLVVLATAAACEEPASDKRRTVVAWVGDDPVYSSELDEYLARNLLDVEGEGQTGERLDEVKSRLLDALLDEKLLLAEAERAEIEVTDAEVSAYLSFGAEDDTVEITGERTLEARRRLMIEKLQEQVVRQQLPPGDEEVAAWAERHRDRLLPGRPVELRALQLRSLDVATRVHEDIRRRRVTFREAVIAHEPSPGQTVPLRVSWGGLSEEVRRAIENLKPGEVSSPVELHGRVYLFELGSWLQDPADLEAELHRRARQEIETTRRQEALEGHVRRLRARTPPRIKRASLPFSYLPAQPG